MVHAAGKSLLKVFFPIVRARDLPRAPRFLRGLGVRGSSARAGARGGAAAALARKLGAARSRSVCGGRR